MGLETVIVAKSMESNIQTYKDIKTQSDAVLYFLQKLDIEMIDTLLEENRTYQDFEKPVFVSLLGAALDEFIQAGDTFLQRYPGFCNAKNCNYKCKGFTFIGNHSGNYFDLIFDIQEGVVQDMYECTIFKCLDHGLLRNTLVEIDKT